MLFQGILALHILIWLAGFVLLIYFAIKRIQTKKEEHFEQRDN